MKPDCYAVVNEKDETIWVGSSGQPALDAVLSFEALRDKYPDQTLELIKSFTDKDGKEVLAELLSPWAYAVLTAHRQTEVVPEPVVIEVWQALAPKFGMTGTPSELSVPDYAHCVNVVVAKDDNFLNAAYTATQNIDKHWRPRNPCRSTSVGDVLVVKGDVDGFDSSAFVVASVGFKNVVFR